MSHGETAPGGDGFAWRVRCPAHGQIAAQGVRFKIRVDASFSVFFILQNGD